MIKVQSTFLYLDENKRLTRLMTCAYIIALSCLFNRSYACCLLNECLYVLSQMMTPLPILPSLCFSVSVSLCFYLSLSVSLSLYLAFSLCLSLSESIHPLLH